MSNANYQQILEIPVATYVKHILDKVEQAGPDGVVHLRENTLAGKALLHVAAELPFADSTSLPHDKIKLRVSARLYSHYSRWKGPELMELGYYFEKVAQRILFTWIDVYRSLGHTKVDAVAAAYQYYNITEWDYPQENLLQLYKLQQNG